MADNVDITPGTGATVSTEQVTTLNGATAPAQHIQRMLLAYRSADGIGIDLPADATYGLGVDVKRSALPSGAATEATLATLAGYLDGVEALLGRLTSDPATQTTLAAALVQLSAIAGSTDGVEGKLDTLHTDLAAVDGHVDGLEGAFTTLNAKDFATQTTLAAVLAKIIAAPATEAKQDSQATKLDTLHTDLVAVQGYVDGLEGKDYATQTTLAALLAKVIAAPSTEAKQDALIALLPAALSSGRFKVEATPTSGATFSVDSSTLATNAKLEEVRALLDGGFNVSGSLDVNTELPAAAALSDADANPTTAMVGAAGQVWDSAAAKWVRAGNAKAAADGADGAAAQRIHPLVYNGSTFDRIRAALGGNVGTLAQAGDSLVVTGTGVALNDTPIAATDVRAYRQICIQLTGTFSATLTFEGSNDNSTWQAVPLKRFDNPSGALSSTNGTGTLLYTGPVPYRYFRARVSAYTSGTVTATALFTAHPAAEQWIVAGLAAGSNQIGYVRSQAVWFDDSSTPLVGAATFTGTARDLIGAGAGSSAGQSGNGIGPVELRLSAAADVAGTLYLEESRDNSTWRRVKGVALAAFDGTCVLYGEIIHRPSARYGRMVFVNGGGAQAHFTAQTMVMGAT